MARLHIPILNIPRQTATVRLPGIDVRLTVWLQPDDGWYLDVEAPVGTRIASGRRLVSDGDPLAGLVTPLAGNLNCESLTFDKREPLTDPWDNTHRLIYDDGQP